MAIARSLYRSEESVRCLMLEEVDVTIIDMFTVMLIGNSRTFLHQGRMIRPGGTKSRNKLSWLVPLQDCQFLIGFNEFG